MFANVNVTKLTWLIKYCQTMLHNKINDASWEKKKSLIYGAVASIE